MIQEDDRKKFKMHCQMVVMATTAAALAKLQQSQQQAINCFVLRSNSQLVVNVIATTITNESAVQEAMTIVITHSRLVVIPNYCP